MYLTEIQKSTKEPWKRFLSGYYISNIILLLSYIVFRLMIKNTRDLESVDIFGISREGQIIFCLIVVLLVKIQNSPTWDSYIGAVFFWSKICILLLSLFVYWRFALYYLFSMLGIKVVWPQPEYEGPQNIVLLDNDTLESLVLNDPDTYWLVEFYTTWSPPCLNLAPLFANLSLKYGSSSLRFGKIDVGRYIEVAETYRISVEGSSRQLPTLILFERGREVTRLPLITENRVLKCSFKEKDIIAAFDLEYATKMAPKNITTKQSGRSKHQRGRRR